MNILLLTTIVIPLGHNFSDGDIPYNKLNRDEEMSAKYIFPKLLDAGIRVLLYNGDEDVICNWIGNSSNTHLS